MPRRPHRDPDADRGAWLWLGAGVVLLVLVAAVLPNAIGFRTYVVRSESMEPSISRGDVLVSYSAPAREAKPGNVVTFPDPAGSGESITHRVRVAESEGDRRLFVTQGDANSGVERWEMGADEELPRLSYRIPLLGHPVLAAQSGSGRLILVGIGCLATGLVLLARRWGLGQQLALGFRRLSA